jgi:hypothetical protein
MAKTPQVPCELARASVLALLVYLKEGERPCLKLAATSFRENAQQPPDLSQHLFHAKVLCFLVACLVILLPVLVKNNDGEDEDDGLLSDVLRCANSSARFVHRSDFIEAKYTSLNTSKLQLGREENRPMQFKGTDYA